MLTMPHILVIWQTTLLLTASNVFMTFAWFTCGRLCVS
jgi:uncharacterized protein (DUF486 family)